MSEEYDRYHRLIDGIQQANRIAATTRLDTLLDQMLNLLVSLTRSRLGVLSLFAPRSEELVVTTVAGPWAKQNLVGGRFRADQGITARSMRQHHPLFIDEDAPLHGQHALAAQMPVGLRTVYSIPLLLPDHPIGVVELFNVAPTVIDNEDELTLVELLVSRLVTAAEKLHLLEEARQREQRLHSLIDTMSQITTTLEQDTLLDQIMSHATQLLNVEAASIWLRDEQSGELVLRTATGEQSQQMHATDIRVPPGQGIIGYVTLTGERVLINDVQHDARFYAGIDQQSGFHTRSILCVPLHAPAIQLGSEQGHVSAKIIGGAEALNRRDGQPFDSEDVRLMEALASQAATVLQLSRLYERNTRLFMGIIRAVSGAIDLKDPYTSGHSQRVADFAVAIAREMDLSQEMMYHVEVGGILHDVGKIGVSDQILRKPGNLTSDEIHEMQQHPLNGIKLLENAGLDGLLYVESAALSQHHERLDGGGYPLGLKGDQISLIGRIVAVADAFDAMTSTRPYRAGMPVEQALDILQSAAHTEYDAQVVQALVQARAQGLIHVQAERG